ncbi:rab-GTPase-TBC domain-containing protein [Dactylonectria estremocensis]|uniref:Rab-GTPase-TBC domain-containing protein n=1 Tax=Dactylonectria estremocensis TaxID=1079267 RepID=A0A9P9JIE3_9HYPO|nr:rab-GTPase-TBC domain-containing protein [Dactylonectria estremocensis]
MKSLEELLSRWRETQAQGAHLTDLQHAVKYNGSSSPCLSGCRSLCWKMFLLSSPSAGMSWSHTLDTGRRLYTEKHQHFLKFIQHPEALAELTIDPLADDPDSPWNTVRQDEIIRAEIKQDVQRLPDEASYHQPHTQAMIIDVLFMYCKINPERGGYRQGMHELLAPMVYAIQEDALDLSTVSSDATLDDVFLNTLDATFIEHDAFVLFARVMEHAQFFYEIKEPPTDSTPGLKISEQSSAIVERSKFIHEVCLHKVDPELAAHLTNIEILPQIFLIRWVRLLFSREFPFEQFLVLWDTIFAVDPSLELIDLICVAMLTRIRWELLEADYSVCLQLLLKYPPPAQPHGPHTFVDDALYLKNHLTPSGGASLILKYTGKMPNVSSPPNKSSRSATPNSRGFNSLRNRGFGQKSPIPSPSRFIQQQGGMEALFQGAAKGAMGVLERGEKLGINQAVRDAMGEIKRNINEARHTALSPRQLLNDEGAVQGLVALERRNRQLAAMLDETVNNLKALSASSLSDKAKSLELLEIAAAKVQFVKIYLEDSSMEVPILDSSLAEKEGQLHVVVDSAATEGPESGIEPSATADFDIAALKITEENSALKKDEKSLPPTPDLMDTSTDNVPTDPLAAKSVTVSRPQAPVPTRSTLAQSSFSWMLEPDEPGSSQPSAATKKTPVSQQKKRISNSHNRERNAFLFGEVTSNSEGRNPLSSDEIFGLEPIFKPNTPEQ